MATRARSAPWQAAHTLCGAGSRWGERSLSQGGGARRWVEVLSGAEGLRGSAPSVATGGAGRRGGTNARSTGLPDSGSPGGRGRWESAGQPHASLRRLRLFNQARFLMVQLVGSRRRERSSGALPRVPACAGTAWTGDGSVAKKACALFWANSPLWRPCWPPGARGRQWWRRSTPCGLSAATTPPTMPGRPSRARTSAGRCRRSGLRPTARASRTTPVRRAAWRETGTDQVVEVLAAWLGSAVPRSCASSEARAPPPTPWGPRTACGRPRPQGAGALRATGPRGIWRPRGGRGVGRLWLTDRCSRCLRADRQRLLLSQSCSRPSSAARAARTVCWRGVGRAGRDGLASAPARARRHVASGQRREIPLRAWPQPSVPPPVPLLRGCPARALAPRSDQHRRLHHGN